jgi:hypothetical protein
MNLSGTYGHTSVSKSYQKDQAHELSYTPRNAPRKDATPSPGSDKRRGA